MIDWVWDIETYPNYFCARFMHVEHGTMRFFEISDRRNDLEHLHEWVGWLRQAGQRMVGFNNVGFDYPVLHDMMLGACSNEAIYRKVQSIISGQDRFGSRVRAADVLVPQLDLYLIHHFDNKARSTSLKKIEFAMRSHLVQELPIPVGTWLTHEQMDVVADYNFHDVAQTLAFYWKSREMIEFREQLTAKYNRDFINHNDTKIGKDYFIMELEAAGVPCYEYSSGGRQPRQTVRPIIALRDAILPWIKFERPEFQRVLDWLREQTITETKGVFTDIIAKVDGFDFVFGLGGIHGSVKNTIVEADADYAIIDIDVESYYPSTAIAQRFKPAHYPDVYCDIYANLKEQRKQYKKGTPENAMLKLALNGTFGDGNNKFSVFYDPLTTMSITLNGQLLLCLLCERLMSVKGVSIVAGNTDGATFRVRRSEIEQFNRIVAEWEVLTKLKMERAEYKRMFIRDVNTYLAEYTNGKLKRKGAFEYNLAWHQDHSEMIVAKAAEAVLIEGANLAEFIYGHTDIHDFLMCVKVPRSSGLRLEDGTELPNIIRYYISTDGKALQKIMPPPPGRVIGDFKQASGVSDAAYVTSNRTGTHDASIHTKNGSRYETRQSGIHVGYKVSICNDLRDFRQNINYQYYIDQAKSLIDAVGNSG